MLKSLSRILISTNQYQVLKLKKTEFHWKVKDVLLFYLLPPILGDLVSFNWCHAKKVIDAKKKNGINKAPEIFL